MKNLILTQKKFSRYIAVIAIFALFSFGFVLAGCGGTENNAASTTPAQNKKSGEEIRILTSFYPMYIMAQNIAGGIDGVTIDNLAVPSAGCLHDYQLTTADMKKFSTADIFIVNGLGMESFIAKASETNKKMAVITASEQIAPDFLIENGEGINPHVWLSFAGAKSEVATIAGHLARLDPSHDAQYRANAERYQRELDNLAAEAGSLLNAVNGREIVTFHEAFPYFAREAKLKIIAVIEREPGSEPSPSEIAATIAAIKQHGVKAICIEPQYPAKTAETIARETGTKIITLDPCVTGDPAAKDAYLAAMRRNIHALAEVLKRPT